MDSRIYLDDYSALEIIEAAERILDSIRQEEGAL